MKINLGEKFRQEQCCKCGLHWVVAKGQKTNNYVCPWCSSKRKGAKRCKEN